VIFDDCLVWVSFDDGDSGVSSAEYSREEKEDARLSDRTGEEPPTVDVSSGCRSPAGSISRPGWFPPRNPEKILLEIWRMIVLGRVDASQKQLGGSWSQDQECVDPSESGSIYTQTCCISFAGKYDIYCLFSLIFDDVKIVASEVAARDLSSARACCKRSQRV